MDLNQSGKPTQLEFLPPELQCQILMGLSDMKTLRALLRASPRCFQVYRTCREMVLSHVGWNHISPAVVPIALDALEMREDWKFQRDRTKPLLSRKTIKEPHEIPLSTWERLLSFHEIVDSFISGFTNSRLVALETSIHPESQTSLPSQNISPSTHLTLSQLEYSRLARAFYNLERYGHLFHDLETPRFTSQLTRNVICRRARNFLESLRDWEVEELLCVRSYMIERLEDYLNRFEHNFMEAFQKEMPYINWPLPDYDFRSWPNLRTPGLTYLADLLSEEGYDWSQSAWVESCLTRGIETLAKILSTDTFQAEINTLWKWQLGDKNISQVLTHMSGTSSCSEQELAVKMKSPEIGYYDNIEQPNEAWFWGMKPRGHPRIAMPRNFLRTMIVDGWDSHNSECCWGYVIWDHERLTRLGILSKSPSDIMAIIGTDWRVERTPMSLEIRTKAQEEIWSLEGRLSTLTEPRPLFDWEKGFRYDSN